MGQDRRWWGYLDAFDGLMGDKRTRTTFRETVRGVINAGSLVCQQIASHSPVLSAAKESGQRVSRFARGESTKRSQIDAPALTKALRERGIAHLTAREGSELWLIADGSDLRKPHAREMPDLMEVRGLDGTSVRGYRTMNVIGLTPGRRAVLYHRLFSSHEETFLSESKEVQTALQTVSHHLAQVKKQRAVTWILDSGFDDVAVWRTIWEQEEHVVCRVKHPERCIEYKNDEGCWVEGDIAAAREEMTLVAEARAELLVRRGRQRKAKRQQVPVEIRSVPIRVTYDTAVRREGEGKLAQKELWLVEVHLVKTHLKRWLLVTDWPVTNPARALRVFQMYRQRWSVEIVFTQMTKTHVLAAWVSRDHISDLDIVVGDQYPVDQQLHQFPLLLERGVGQTRLNTTAEALDRRTQLSQLPLPIGLMAELFGLLFQPLVLSF